MQAHFEKAAELCRIGEKENLFVYLAVPDTVDADHAKKKLKARRKYLQGMQNNPKFKTEAVYLIKNYSAIESVFSDKSAYIDFLQREKEAVHLPMMLMTIRTLLQAGPIPTDQQHFLEKQAKSLNISSESFNALLQEAIADGEHGAPQNTLPPKPAIDAYALLNVLPSTDQDQIYAGYKEMHADAQAIPNPEQRRIQIMLLDQAWRSIGSPEARQNYDLARSLTAPPAHVRGLHHRQTATAAPGRSRASRPNSSGPLDETAARFAPVNLGTLSRGAIGQQHAQLLLEGPHNRIVHLTGKPASVELRVKAMGEGIIDASVSTDSLWLRPSPAQLRPELTEQSIFIEIIPELLNGLAPTGVVSIHCAGFAPITVFIEARSQRANLPVVVIGAVLTFAIVVLIGGLLYSNVPASLPLLLLLAG